MVVVIVGIMVVGIIGGMVWGIVGATGTIAGAMSIGERIGAGD
jgi:hypothetical protein